MAGLLSRILRRGVISEEELPSCLRADILQALPSAQFGEINRRSSRSKRWREEYEALVQMEGSSVEIDAEVDIENDSVYELEINFVLGAANRRIDGPDVIPIEHIPAEVSELAFNAVSTMTDGFVPEKCERGMCGGSTAFRIKGSADVWKVKVKVVEDGTVLEMQKKRMARGA